MMKTLPEQLKRKYELNWSKFVFRILVLAGILIIVFNFPEEMKVLEGMEFFRHFSVLHVFWMLWLWYMLEKLLPIRDLRPLGADKYHKSCYQPGGQPEMQPTYAADKKQADIRAGMVLLAWVFVAGCLFWFKHKDWFDNRSYLILTGLFYIGDMVCLLIWCPFRDVFMKNRCCTQCRIYNWDTWMLVLPLAFTGGFYGWSLFGMALIAAGVWELQYHMHPERFYPQTNAGIRCENCKGEIGCKIWRERETGVKGEKNEKSISKCKGK